jgi:hypothetical protein
MPSGTDVRQVMLGVEMALTRALRSGQPLETLILDGMDPSVFGIENLRRVATISMEFHSGSDRPVFGPTVRYLKRLLRRGLRWYAAGLFDQQSRFNHRVVDVLAHLMVQHEHLLTDLAMVEHTVQEQKRYISELQNALLESPPKDAPSLDVHQRGR